MRRSIRALRARWRRFLELRHKPLGLRGEELAVRYLRRQGCVIVARDVRLPGGEIDIVAVQQRTLLFVEVKTRSFLIEGESIGTAVSDDKERRITRAAYAFLKRHRLLDYPMRFDVITVYWPDDGAPELRHFPHAFEAAGDESGLY